MPSIDRDRISELEVRLSGGPRRGAETVARSLEMLADLYIQADSYVPALATLRRLLDLPAARELGRERRAAFEIKFVSCLLARGECREALGHCRDQLADAGLEGPARTRLQLAAGEALFRLSRLSEARVEGEKALAQADAQRDLRLAASALNLLGRVDYREAEPARARDHYEQALALYRRLGDEVNVARLRNNLGLLHKNLCEWAAAIAHLDDALGRFRALGRFADTGPPLMNLGIVHQKSGAWDLALQHYQEAGCVFRQVGDDHHLLQVEIGLGNVARLQRRFDDAAGALEAALGRARRLGARREEALALEFLGETEFDRGRAAGACARYREALTLAEDVAGDGDLVFEIERRLAEALAETGEFDEAEARCAHATALARRAGDRLEFAACRRVAGAIARARGRRDEANAAWAEAARLLEACNERHELAGTLLALGRSETDAGAARRHLYRAGALYAGLNDAHGVGAAEGELERLRANVPAAPGRRPRAPSLVAFSSAMRRVEATAMRAAATELSVLITGATGTGKELVARTIHAASSRRDGPFIPVNCGALRAELALSQLFGHRKGAFTGAHCDGRGLVEAGHGGTLFLDEVGELPPDVQVALLRFLESGEYLRLGETELRRADVRVIAATNRELRSPSGEAAFRRDLLFRLDEIGIRLPALRERPADILALARHFLSFYGGLEAPTFSPEAESVLLSYGWPGNVRELENLMKRIAALHDGDGAIGVAELMPFLDRDSVPARRGDAEVEKAALLAAHRAAGGNRSRMAQLLGISRKTLYARLRRLGVELP